MRYERCVSLLSHRLESVSYSSKSIRFTSQEQVVISHNANNASGRQGANKLVAVKSNLRFLLLLQPHFRTAFFFSLRMDTQTVHTRRPSKAQWLTACITSCMYHLLHVSPPACITSCVYHLLRVSPPACITSCMYHLLHVSPPATIYNSVVCPQNVFMSSVRI
jgi:hypothetical protein